MAIRPIFMSPPIFVPNVSSLSNRNSIPRIDKLLCYAASSETKTIRSEVSFHVGTHLIPHPQKADRGGEDAFFVNNYNGVLLLLLTVFLERGSFTIPTGLDGCLVGDDEVNYDPQILIRKAHGATSSVGSATVIVAMLELNGMLKIANDGDCGLRAIRGGRIFFSTSPQEHYFDCPYQLSSEMVGQTYLDAVVSTVEVMEGDTIVMGSDGLFDNVFDDEIVSTVSTDSDATEAAEALANLAFIHSMDSKFESPYSMEARSKGFDVPFWKIVIGMKLTGGKLDDVTVIVGRVVSSHVPPRLRIREVKLI